MNADNKLILVQNNPLCSFLNGNIGIIRKSAEQGSFEQRYFHRNAVAIGGNAGKDACGRPVQRHAHVNGRVGVVDDAVGKGLDHHSQTTVKLAAAVIHASLKSKTFFQS